MLASTSPKSWWSERAQAIEVAIRALPVYLPKQRWYPAKEAGPPTVALNQLVPLDCFTGPAAIATWHAKPAGRPAFTLFLPLAVMAADDIDGTDPGVIGRLNAEEVLVDGFANDGFVRCFVAAILHQSRASETLQFGSSSRHSILEETLPSQWQIARGTAEQSNTSIRIGGHAMLKAVRKVLPGIHPELEMSRFFAESRFDAVAALLGWADLQGTTIAVLQEFVPNQGDGWKWIQARLGGDSAERARTFPWIERLGARTAQMHCALAAPSVCAAFDSEPAEPRDWDRWVDEMTMMSKRVAEVLKHAEMDAGTRDAAAEFDRHRDEMLQVARGWISPAPIWAKTRHHGDFHLGQVLVKGEDCVIVDFEGEPLRSLAERRAKQIPLRDVAGMLRSFDYAGTTLERELPISVLDHGRAEAWVKEASWIYVESYLRTAGLMGEQPLDEASARRVIAFFSLQKALYEILYEAANRPDWIRIPLKGALALLREASL